MVSNDPLSVLINTVDQIEISKWVGDYEEWKRNIKTFLNVLKVHNLSIGYEFNPANFLIPVLKEHLKLSNIRELKGLDSHTVSNDLSTIKLVYTLLNIGSNTYEFRGKINTLIDLEGDTTFEFYVSDHSNNFSGLFVFSLIDNLINGKVMTKEEPINKENIKNIGNKILNQLLDKMSNI
ncbi:hypothetical protein FC682_23085 [Peribacillus simplex]|uniref:hypothetical protein n=1 Tax=Peribacillus simplex TaxID=1478 RepID=UPI0010BEC005|nr:hypothetical protein [Peribacillus simplex]TKH01451.1 hypothetical protein FC682_23085 [Peribacillus simplex]